MRLQAALFLLSVLAVGCSGASHRLEPARENLPVLQRGWTFSESNEEYFKTVDTGVAPVDFASPTLVDDKVVVATARLGLAVLHKDNGQVLWHHRFKGEGFASRPFVFQNKVVVGSEEGDVYCFQLDSGVQLWKTELPAPVRSAPTIASDRIIVAAADESVSALDPATGKILWTYRRPSFVGTSVFGTGSPTVIGSRIWIGFSDGALVALEPNDGSLQVEKSFRDNLKFNDIDAKPLLWKENIIVASYDGKLRMLKRDGTVVWEFAAGGVHAPVITNFRGGSLAFSSSDGNIYLIQTETGREIWHRTLHKGIPTGVGVFDDDKEHPIAVVSSSDQYIYAFDLATGKELNHISLGRGSGSFSAVAVDPVKRYAFILSQFSRLYQLRVR